MIPATVMRARSIKMMIVVAGRKSTGSYSRIVLCRKTRAIAEKIDTERSGGRALMLVEAPKKGASTT